VGADSRLTGLVRSAPRVYGAGVYLIVFLVARGIVILVTHLAERRGRKRPPEGRDDDELVLAA
jgi:hypothetical protein